MHVRYGSWLLFAAALAGCSESHASDVDAFVAAMDAGARDASADGARPDAPTDDGDAGADAGLVDGGAIDGAIVDRDGGVTCTPDSCGSRTCGRSDCGASCGECPSGTFCDRFGTCTGTPVGTSCIDAFGEVVAYGASGFAVCATDPGLLARCSCSAGDWSACGPCMDVRLDGARGDRCATGSQCADPVPCHPTLRLCGESCEAGRPAMCPTGTRCGIPGDVTGACLPECATCGASCGDSRACRRAEDGNVCVPQAYGWASSC